MASYGSEQYDERELEDQDTDFGVSGRDFTNLRTRKRDSRYERGAKEDEVVRIRETKSVNGGGYHPGQESDELSVKSGAYMEQETKENGHTLLVESKKRKITPIVWDREDKDVSTSSKSRASYNTSLPPPPPLSKTYRKSSNSISEECVEISPAKYNDSHSNHSLDKPLVDVSGLRIDLSSSPQEHKSNSYQEKENQDCFPRVNILSSRWASDVYSPPDEGEIADDVDLHMRRKMIISRLDETNRSNNSSTPEGKELKREILERSRERSTSIDAYYDDDFEINEKEHGKYKDSDTQSQTDSDYESDKSSTPEPQRSLSMLEGCRSVDEYERLNRISEGTYGVVYRAKDKKTGEIVALKKIKMEKEREGFPLTALREINILLSFHHPSIVDVKEVVMGNNLDHIFMVMEYMEHDVKALMEAMKQPFSQSEVKCLMVQLLEGVKYLHDNWVLHRDLKTSNLLMNNQGELKICDFGLARQYGSPLKPYTHLVVTLWYRAPELLLGQKEYSTAIDMWSLGCIMAELLSKEPLFNGKAEVDQLDKIFRMLGTPNEIIWPGFSKLPGVKVNFVKHRYNQLRKKFRATTFTGSPVLSDAGLDLLNKLLTYDPEKRITAEAALKHSWFSEVPLPKSKEFMPTFPAQNAQDRRFRKVMKSPDPLKEQLLKELKEREAGSGGLFG